MQNCDHYHKRINLKFVITISIRDYYTLNNGYVKIRKPDVFNELRL